MKKIIICLFFAMMGFSVMIHAQTNANVTITGTNGGSATGRSFLVPPDPQRGWITTNSATIGTLVPYVPDTSLQTIGVAGSGGGSFVAGTSVTNSFTIEDTRTVSEIEVKVVVDDLFFTENYIVIIPPNGESYFVYTGVLGFASGNLDATISNVKFSMNAKAPLLTSRSPVIGTFLPETALNNLDFPAGGTWSLIVGKTWGSVEGTLQSFNVTVKVRPQKSNGFGFSF